MSTDKFELIKSLVLLTIELLFGEEHGLDHPAIEPSTEKSDFSAFSLHWTRKQHKGFPVPRHSVRVTIQGRPRHDNSFALTILLHLVLNIELQLDVVKSLLDLFRHDHIFEAEALGGLVLDQRFKDFTCTRVSRGGD